MKRSEYEAKMKKLQDEIEALKKVEIEEDSKRWKPSPGRMYYYTTGIGKIGQGFFNDDTSNSRYAMGNCFKTEDEADFAVQKLKVIAELKEFAEPDDAKWDGNVPHYFINYNVTVREFCIDFTHAFKHATLYFASAKAACKAIEKIGKERIKKYYLEVVE